MTAPATRDVRRLDYRRGSMLQAIRQDDGVKFLQRACELSTGELRDLRRDLHIMSGHLDALLSAGAGFSLGAGPHRQRGKTPEPYGGYEPR